MPRFSRRRFFASAAAIPMCLRAAGSPLRIVVTGGHPGDPEYGCGGAVARYTDLGHNVTLLYLNRGEKGCPEPDPGKGSGVRVPEARRACEILKAKPAFAGQCDAHPIVDQAHADEFRSILAGEKPDILFTHWPIDNHVDHRAIGMLSYDGWLRLGKKFAFYFYEVSNGSDTQAFVPTDYVDITATEARKKAACYAHASQSPDRFYALQSAVARFRGIESGFQLAEAYARHPQSPKAFLP